MNLRHAHIDVLFEQQDQALAGALLQSTQDILRRLEQNYALAAPRRVKVVVLTSWQSFPFQTAPWYLQPVVVLTFPFWAARTRRIWPLAGGWQQSYPGGTAAVGIKPPRLMQTADRSLGAELFLDLKDPRQKQHSILAHELTHACTSHLRLPAWLHEGLAMVASDHLLGKATVLPESRRFIRAAYLTQERQKRAYQGRDREGLLALYAAGYWLVRWLEEMQPAILKSLLNERRRPQEVVEHVAGAFGCQPEALWAHVEAIAGDESRGFAKLDV